MKLPEAFILVILYSSTTTSIASYSKDGCEDMCGKVRIPFPFGIGTSCSVNRWYTVDCNSSTPYLSAFNHLQVLGVNLELQTITVNTPKYYDCQNLGSETRNIDLGKSPFLFSKSHNKFVFEGCGSARMMDHGTHVLTGCSNNCLNDTLSDRNSCFGDSCCQNTIPRYLKAYDINITRQSGDDRGCGSAFLVDETSYVEGDNNSYIPTSLLWTLSDADIYVYPMVDLGDKVRCYYQPSIVEVDLGDGTPLKSWKCSTWPGEGNPYLFHGINGTVTDDCAKCRRSGNDCHYDEIYDPDGVLIKWNATCVDYGWLNDKENKISLGVILGNAYSRSLIGA
ncbi:putative wall-associated receptor kinase, galacturonan-binding domain-containing protein [Helianthus annuus]|nr:putative wall-associated receptor kinase, galacturonan-binding domain-containing protein [Helianthus annuus]KAJ0473853.1 putative wall-associated receptor kinase, galacturonan-binding domain-containing protein [Helianthus annuus]KAJ0649429.1 putative wall-associated receptor kinase, galacturonan-binding domain-containing protein [Helianthus annuus]KAJ0653231.1 putative wall-associated receptor kinase, galacturonan-binding domain-containing protein [Helianthus annuus]KAJ0845651.1 putative wal